MVPFVTLVQNTFLLGYFNQNSDLIGILEILYPERTHPSGQAVVNRA